MKIKWILLLLLILLIGLIIKTMYDAGSFKTIEPHFEGKEIITYTNVAGPEDLDVDDESGLLFISSTDRRKSKLKYNETDGIYLLDLNDIDGVPELIESTYKGVFHPHGISVLRIDSLVFLHVVNHNQDGDFVEIFQYLNDTLFHLSSISDPLMVSPNDVVAVDVRKFYATNDHGSEPGWKRTLEDYLKRPWANIMYFDGSAMRIPYEGMKYANGINVSRDGNKIYVTETTGNNFLEFDRNAATGRLSYVSSTKISSGLDNIDVDSDGNIWIGSHPKLFDFIGHASDPEKHSPSQVLVLSPSENDLNQYHVNEIFLDDGSKISGSSVAVKYKNDYLIGVVFENKVMRISLVE